MQKNRVWKAAAGGMLMGGILSSAHAQAGPCRDPWINQAFHQMYNRPPAGSGTTGECDITRYGNGHWSSYQDLMSKISQHNGAVRSIPPSSAAAQYAPLMRPSPTPQPVATVPPSSASVANRTGSRIISQDEED